MQLHTWPMIRLSFYIAALFGTLSVSPLAAFGDFIYTGSRNSSITRVNESTGEVVAEFATILDDGFSDFRGMSFGPDGLLYVSGSRKLSRSTSRWGVFKFNPHNGKFVENFLLDGPINSISFGSDGHMYGVDSWTDSLRQFDGASGEFLRTVLSGNDFQTGVGTFTLGNNEDVFASFDSSMLARFDLTTGQRIGPITDLKSIGLLDYRFDQMTSGPDGKLYATYNYRKRDQVRDGGVMVFDSQSGAYLDTIIDDLPAFGAANGGRLGISFGPDGSLYIGSQHANAVLRYNSSTFEFIEQFPMPSSIASASFIQFLPVPEPTGFYLVIGAAVSLLSSRSIRYHL